MTFPHGTRCVYCGRKPRKWATGTGATPMCANVTRCLAERDKGNPRDTERGEGEAMTERICRPLTCPQ